MRKSKATKIQEQWAREDLAEFTRTHPVAAWRNRAVQHLAGVMGFEITARAQDGWYWFSFGPPGSSEDAFDGKKFIAEFWEIKHLNRTPASWKEMLLTHCGYARS